MRGRWLVRLYPARWRRRFGDELAALLEDEPLTPRIVLDVIGGAVAAYRDPYPPSEESAMTRTRVEAGAAALAAIAMLPAAVFFAAAIVRGLQPSGNEPARTADAIFRAFAGLPGPEALALLGVAPAVALVLALAMVASRFAGDASLRADLAGFAAATARLARHPAFVVAFLVAAASALILVFWGVHLVVG